MMELIVYITLFVVGAAMGSFAAASVWRLRAADLRHNPAQASSPAEKRWAKQLGKRPLHRERSQCLHCGYQLAWYDLLPVVSWLALGGKCRRCRKPIGRMELWAELGVGAVFVLSYLAFEQLAGQPLGASPWLWLVGAAWLVALVLLAVQWMYDAKWYSLLTPLTIALGVCALISKAALLAAGLVAWPELGLNLALALVLMPGLYGVLCAVSRQTWVGLGDVYLLVPFALFVPTWQQAFLVVFLANLLGCLVIIPGLMRGRITRRSRVPFGPFLIAAFVLAMLWGQQLVAWYYQALFGSL